MSVEAYRAMFQGHTPVRFEITRMRGAIYIWIGMEHAPSCAHLQLDTGSANTNIMGSENIPLARRLAKKLECFVYLSYNLPEEENMMTQWAESVLVKHVLKD
jgi:hypothetical protein